MSSKITLKSELLENYTNKEYLKNHLEEYKELFKEIDLGSRFVLNPLLILDRYDVFYCLMKMIESGELQKIFELVGETEFQKIYKRIESQMFQT